MKILTENMAYEVTASSEAENTPAINVLSENSRELWYPADADSSPSVTVTISPGCNTVLVYNVAAASARVRVYTIGGSTVSDVTHTLEQSSDWEDTYYIDRLWTTFEKQTGELYCTVYLTRGSVAPIGVGVIFAGYVKASFSDPDFGGIAFEPIDHSQLIDLGGGVTHPLQKNMQETFPLGLEVRDESEASAFMRVARQLGITKPFACLVHDTYTPKQEVISYCTFSDMPKRRPVKYMKNTLDFKLEEKL